MTKPLLTQIIEDEQNPDPALRDSSFFYKNRLYTIGTDGTTWRLFDHGEVPEYLNVDHRGGSVIYKNTVGGLHDLLEHASIDGRSLLDILSHYEEEYNTDKNPVRRQKYSFDLVKQYLRQYQNFHLRIKLTEDELRSPPYKTKYDTKEVHYVAEICGEEWEFYCANPTDFDAYASKPHAWVPEPEGVTPLPQDLTTEQLIEFLGERFFIRGRSFKELCDNYDKQDLIDLTGLA
jgi:hypothetical protein